MFGFDDLLRLGAKSVGKEGTRPFTQTEKKEILRQQDRKCAVCHMKLDPHYAEFYPAKAWCDKGRKKIVNGQAICGSCHKVRLYKDRLKGPGAEKA